VLDILIDFLFPKKCVGCGVEGVFLCSECREKFDFADQICPMCGEGSVMGWTHEKCKTKYGMDGLIVVYEYQEEIMKKVIEGIKFGFNKELVKILLSDFVFESGESFDCLVFVPLYFCRQNWRGFNQAEEIAKVIGEKMNLPVSKYLKRNRMTKQQALMKTKDEREKNIFGAFEISNDYLNMCMGKKVLLVDDVFTSGNDMRECAKILKKAGVITVWGLSLGH